MPAETGFFVPESVCAVDLPTAFSQPSLKIGSKQQSPGPFPIRVESTLFQPCERRIGLRYDTIFFFD